MIDMTEARTNLVLRLVNRIDHDDTDPDHAWLFEEVRDVTRALAALDGRYIDTDAVQFGKLETYYTGEASDCIVLAMTRGEYALMSHVQGHGDAEALAEAIAGFAKATRRYVNPMSIYLWTQPTTFDMSYRHSSRHVLMNGLANGLGHAQLFQIADRITLVTGYSGYDWNGKVVAYTGGRTGAFFSRKAHAPPEDLYQGFELAAQFLEM